jgi:hypothetical protein
VKVIERHDVIDEILGAWTGALGSSRAAYRGHVYRVFNAARWIAGSERYDPSLAVASAFHDLGIWSDGTFDYLAPSAARARDFLATDARAADTDLVERAIANHHRLRKFRGAHDAAAVDAFRRADLVDVSRGLLRAGLDRGRWRELVAAFPFAGFHGILVRTAFSWFLRHPLRPLPMLRF